MTSTIIIIIKGGPVPGLSGLPRPSRTSLVSDPRSCLKGSFVPDSGFVPGPPPTPRFTSQVLSFLGVRPPVVDWTRPFRRGFIVSTLVPGRHHSTSGLFAGGRSHPPYRVSVCLTLGTRTRHPSEGPSFSTSLSTSDVTGGYCRSGTVPSADVGSRSG